MMIKAGQNIKIIFLGYWSTPKQLLDQYFKNDTPEGDGIWNMLEGTDDIRKADYYIMFDCGNQNIKIEDYSKVIYIQLEPPGCIKQEFKNKKLPVDKFLYAGTHNKIHIPAFTNYIGKPYKFLKQLNYEARSFKILAICSGKRYTPQHIKRIEFLEFLCTNKVNIDIYGKGLNSSKLKGYYKGEWKPKSKFELLNKYQYCIVLENYIHENHMTEKLYDCFLSLTYPIYNGCTNISKYFNKKSYSQIDIEDYSRSLETIKNVLQTSIDEDTINALIDSRNKVLDKYTIWPTVESILAQNL